MQDFVPTVSQVSKLGYLGKGVSNALDRASALGSRAVAQVEPQYQDLARSKRMYSGGLNLVANAIVPVVNLPTTTAPFCLNNVAPTGFGSRCLVPVHVWVTIGSGTVGAAGFSLFCGVTAAPIATQATSNGTGVNIQSTCGTGTSVAFGNPAITIPSGTAWTVLNGIMTTAVAVTGCGVGYRVDGMFVVPPQFGFVIGILGDTGTSAKYMVGAVWAEVELDLDS